MHFRPGKSTNIQQYCTFRNRFVVICTLGNLYGQVLKFLPVVFVDENMASACEDYTDFSDEALPSFTLDFDNIPFDENNSNDENAVPYQLSLIERTISAKETTQLSSRCKN